MLNYMRLGTKYTRVTYRNSLCLISSFKVNLLFQKSFYADMHSHPKKNWVRVSYSYPTPRFSGFHTQTQAHTHDTHQIWVLSIGFFCCEWMLNMLHAPLLLKILQDRRLGLGDDLSCLTLTKKLLN